jgi:glycyl-tRNA synthetase beta subunit
MQVVNLVEAPVPILGRYDDSFLELPKDVLITVCTAFYCGCLEANNNNNNKAFFVPSTLG